MSVKLQVSAHMTLKIVSIVYLISLTSGQVNFVTDHYKSIGKIKYLKYLSDIFKSPKMMMN